MQYSPETVVSGVAILSTDVGTTTRVRLAVEHDGPLFLPKRWFVKLPSLAWRARLITALPRLLHNEVRFYQEIAHTVPVVRPTVLAAQSKSGKGATLVFSDITESGAIPGSPGDALTAEQAGSVIEKLAHFHARFWNRVHIDRHYRWLSHGVRRLEDALGSVLAVPLMERGLRLAGSVVPACLHAPALNYARQRRDIMRFLNQGPQTLVHRDCHPGNLFWQGNQPGLLDWQLVRMGEGIGDVAYFLATALEPETRRAQEAELIALYQQGLAGHGIKGIEADKLWERYRAHLCYPLEAMLVTLAVGGMMDNGSNLSLISRAAAAAADHDAFAAVGQGGGAFSVRR
ncbi:MAG: phosphotransferase [Gammaproteobacteria bacterium]